MYIPIWIPLARKSYIIIIIDFKSDLVLANITNTKVSDSMSNKKYVFFLYTSLFEILNLNHYELQKKLLARGYKNFKQIASIH